MRETRRDGWPIDRTFGTLGPVLVSGVTFVVVVLVGAVTLLLRGPGSVEPAGLAVFSWDGDDIGLWVTEDEMTAALEDLSWRYRDADLDAEAVLESPIDPYADPEADFAPDGSWRVWRVVSPLGDAGSWSVTVHNGYDYHVAKPSDEVSRPDQRLPAGVRYQRGSGFAWRAYVFSGLNPDEWICITLRPPGTPSLYPHDQRSKNTKTWSSTLPQGCSKRWDGPIRGGS